MVAAHASLTSSPEVKKLLVNLAPSVKELAELVEGKFAGIKAKCAKLTHKKSPAEINKA
jgi:hypothetical protein